MNANDHRIDNMFHSLHFAKTAEEIVVKTKGKIAKIKAKIEERQVRVADLRREHGIDAEAFVQLLLAARKQAGAKKFTYMTSSLGNGVVADNRGAVMEERTIGAGVVNNLLTENDHIETELDTVRRLELIARNLAPVPRFAPGNGVELPPEHFTLSYDELEFLEF